MTARGYALARPRSPSVVYASVLRVASTYFPVDIFSQRPSRVGEEVVAVSVWGEEQSRFAIFRHCTMFIFGDHAYSFVSCMVIPEVIHAQVL